MLRFARLDPAVYRNPEFDDPLLRSLEAKVVIHAERAWAGQRAARLRLTHANGQTSETSTFAVRGDASMPWSEAALTEKFLTYCAGSLSPERAASVAEHLLRGKLNDSVFPPG
jgi:hypothetical protein